ncbi:MULTISPECIES: type IV pilus twitching motility protein PilT [Thermodesulfobacterium]|jgi:twitching motility protein PilT|uniref:Twitching motility protein n=1 Tax=Thermodesulfobacterium commune DSM 2178 TaxID=289377 RepID=A0A075WTF7_9BACT|nr:MULTISPECIES: type IV pilus twitching motility protein PilT [Thermodesulfobacterium]AIH03663.1 twitching motility protein [Thermodesulfobacterium commune DSM 2178]MBZ4681908.1 twitching motility protein [Thermodesulfobacterium sp.]MDN5379447.1 twitching motility protein PilT [Thermodesulfobacterium sp.]
MAKLDAFFKLMVDTQASDLHLSAGNPPLLRIHGDLQRVKYKVLEDEELREMLYEIAPEEIIKKFEEQGEVDWGYEIPGLARFRVNYYRQRRGVAAAFRLIPNKIKTVEELGLPPILNRLALLPRGLVLVTGPTGSGKSTTLAAIIDYANRMRYDHIITIEDPIEFVHEPKNCLINQREVGTHTKSFANALRAALREDPDIIMIGEMRDLETISLALEAALTGHLVFATLHTISAAQTVSRIVDAFPPEERDQIRVSLSEALRAVISQTMFKRIDRPGRIVAMEIMIATPAIRNLIRENKIHQIPSMIQMGRKYGMMSLDDCIMEYLNNKWISPEEAFIKAVDKSRFIPFVQNKEILDFTEMPG